MKDKALATRKLTYLALITAATIVGRTLFQSLPNIQPVTDIILFVTLYFGIQEGFLVGLLTILITNLYMGMGVWTVFQILSYGAVVLVTYILRRVLRNRFYLQVLHSILMGFLYGFVISLFYVLSFMGLEKFLAYYLAGISFDFFHGVGNGVLYIILIPILTRLTDKYFNKEQYRE